MAYTDYAPTIMRQYANSGALTALLSAFDQWVDLSKFTDDFLRDVWDINTATGYGLDVWGRILGRSRYLQIDAPPLNNFGFDVDAPGTNWQPFNVAPFYSESNGATAFALQDPEYRQLLLIKAAANIASCDPASLNALLRSLFGTRGPAFVQYDPAAPMVLDYVLDFFPSPVEQAIIESGLIPVPAGMLVRYRFKQFDWAPFGFDGMNEGVNPEYVTGFDQGPFYSSAT